MHTWLHTNRVVIIDMVVVITQEALGWFRNIHILVKRIYLAATRTILDGYTMAKLSSTRIYIAYWPLYARSLTRHRSSPLWKAPGIKCKYRQGCSFSPVPP